MYGLQGGFLGQLSRARMMDADKGGANGGGSGNPGSADQGAQGKAGEGAAGDDGQADDDGEESDDDEPVQLTKAQLAEMLKKEQRKAVRDYKKAKYGSKDGKDEKPPAGNDSKDNDAERKAKERERLADAAIVQSTAYTVAAELGVDPKKLAIAVRAADLDDISVNSKGKADKEAIRDAMEEILEIMPELKASRNDSGKQTKDPKVIKNKLADGKPSESFTREQIAKMTPAEINANWDKIKNMKL